jgi:hypothetical protein
MTEQQKFMKKYGLSQSGVSLWKKKSRCKRLSRIRKNALRLT